MLLNTVVFGEIPAWIESAHSKNTDFTAHLAAARSINLKAEVAARVRRSSLFVMDKVERTKAFVRAKESTTGKAGKDGGDTRDVERVEGIIVEGTLPPDSPTARRIRLSLEIRDRFAHNRRVRLRAGDETDVREQGR